MKRRDFLKLGILSILPKFSFAKEFDDYKALVIIYLAGGNDSLNMFIPCSEDSFKGYEAYAKARDNIRVKNNILSLETDSEGNLLLHSGSDNPYYVDNQMEHAYLKGFYKHKDLGLATNAVMPEIAHLINKNKIAIINNCGNLIMPATKEELLSKQKPSPPFLFAHNFQTTLMFNGESSVLNYTGWAGRLSDMLYNVNDSDIYALNVSLDGNTHLFDSVKTKPMILPSYGIVKYNNIKRELFENFISIKSDKVGDFYKSLKKHSLILQDVLKKDFENSYEFNSLNPYGLTIFSPPTAEILGERYLKTSLDLLKPLHSIAKWIDIGINRNLKRQIFYLTLGGFDTHSAQNKQHSSLLRGLSYSLGDFYLALEELGIENKVSVMVISEFGRSLGENGDGTDHAWGSSMFVLGGDIKGGMYGDLIDLRLGGDDDISNKGRFIPKISFTQYYATVLRWFGLDENELDIIFPELKNFDIRDLNFYYKEA
jgi:uncharacterized protein (DUF1501 family)